MITAIVYDFDGVMTNNLVSLDNSGQESVFVNRSDGLGVRLLTEDGYLQAILTSEESGPASIRASKLGLEVIQGSRDKGLSLRKWASENDLDLQNIAFVGNDVNDLPALEICGFPILVNDSFLAAVDHRRVFRLSTNGGMGVVRELAGYLLGLDSSSDRIVEFHSWLKVAVA